MKNFLFSLCLFCLYFNTAQANTVVWKGPVDAKGHPTSPVELQSGKMYQLEASGTMTLGSWQQNGQPLMNDSNYEFNSTTSYPRISLKNSSNISLGDGTYHPSHIYQSTPFIADKDVIQFWIEDTDYSDNSGELQVQLTQIDQTSTAPIRVWKGQLSSDGTTSPTIKLIFGQKYQIKVSGTMVFGIWSKNNKELHDDACYEFNANDIPVLLPAFKNSLEISVCDGKYHPNHEYQSEPFIANKNEIRFWVFDTDYRDNSGELFVEVFQIRN